MGPKHGYRLRIDIPNTKYRYRVHRFEDQGLFLCDNFLFRRGRSISKYINLDIVINFITCENNFKYSLQHVR